MHGQPRQHFDYIVVGGGTAGSVVAARLAEQPTTTVCLIEAGPSDEGRPDILAVKNWPHLLGTELDYDYAIEQQARGNSRIRHSRGRVLGGCSSHNSCIAFQAPDEDMDSWHQLGCEGWRASDIHPYYEKVYRTVSLERNPPLNPLSQAFLAAAQQAGFPLIPFRIDGPLREGVGIFHLNAQDGIRQSSSQAYLHPLWFTDPEGHDETLLLAGLKLARSIAKQPAMHHWIKRELAPGSAVQSDRELSEYARRTANTVYHPAGTCRMGDAGDPLTVVDAQLRVKGVLHLRIADASIFPSMISVNPCLTCMMIGEKCADMLKQGS